MRVLILNHPYKECGVYQFAKRLFDLVSCSDKIEYWYTEVESRDAYLFALREVVPDFVVYNWHWDRMPWLQESDMRNRAVKHYFIYHDGSMVNTYDKYLFFGGLDPTNQKIPPAKSVLLPRPLLQYNGVYPVNSYITVGSFGFPAHYKQFPALVKMINRNFSAAKINLHISRPYFGDKPGCSMQDIITRYYRNNTKPGVELRITTQFVSDDELLTFLAGNDINVFFYSETGNPGLSSALDYALSVRRPIALTNVMMLRHVYMPEIDMKKKSLLNILYHGIRPLEKFYHQWYPEKLVQAMNNLFLEAA